MIETTAFDDLTDGGASLESFLPTTLGSAHANQYDFQLGKLDEEVM